MKKLAFFMLIFLTQFCFAETYPDSNLFCIENQTSHDLNFQLQNESGTFCLMGTIERNSPPFCSRQCTGKQIVTITYVTDPESSCINEIYLSNDQSGIAQIIASDASGSLTCQMFTN